MKGQRARKRKTKLARSQRRAAKRRAKQAAQAHRHNVRLQLRREGRKWQRQHPVAEPILRLVAPEPKSSVSPLRIDGWLEKRKAG